MVKIEDVDALERTPASYAGVLEKIEIMRSMLRWTQHLEQDQIKTLLGQCAALRDEVMQLSHTERFAALKLAALPKGKRSSAQRRSDLLERDFVFEGVFGDSPKLLDAFEIAEKAAPTNLPVLIDGESGTGKELMAKVIHTNGARADAPYVSVNCGAIPENLIESELFGHVKGAFTGASANRAGRFESANGGTIFLDEIGELPLSGQVKLLRVLQSHEIQRVGSDQVINVDTRIVAATNRDLKQMSAAGTFREDLFYRLSVINITLPALRDRPDEIPLLVEFFVDEAAEDLGRAPVNLNRRLHAFLEKYPYPGNIRELRNIIYRLSCLAGDTAGLEHLPEDIKPAGVGSSREAEAAAQSSRSLSDVKREASDAAERDFLEQGLMETHGNVTQLASLIEVNRQHLQGLLRKHGLKSKSFKEQARQNNKTQAQ